MPRQANFRQRGAKKKKKEKVQEWKPAPLPEADQHFIDTQPSAHAEPQQDPEWMRGGEVVILEADATAPFGYVDQDLKAYLRSALASLTVLTAAAKEEAGGQEEQEAHDGQSILERTVLRDAVLKEINGHELAVATDPDTSRALELLLGCMEPKQIRVIADRLSGSLETLAKHRFGSHSLQSTMRSLQLLLHASSSLKGKKRAAQEAAIDQGEAGVLRDAATLLLDYSAELLPALPNLTQDPFGTHIVRSLLQVFSGRSLQDASLRSKRSTLYRSRDTAATSLESSNGLASAASALAVLSPASFAARLIEIRQAIMGGLGANEVRAMSVSTTASPTLQVLLEHEETPLPSGPLDLVLDGLITTAAQPPSEASLERSAHVEALLRDVVGSHLLQKALSLLPLEALSLFWKTYIAKRMCNLSAHPVANFVVAACALRLPAALEGKEALLEEALVELEAAGEKLVKEAKLGVLSALVQRAGAVAVAFPPPPPPRRGVRPQTLEQRALTAVMRSFGIDTDEEEQRKLAVQVVLCMKTRKRWEKERNRLAERERTKATVTAKAHVDGEEEPKDEEMNLDEPETGAQVAEAEPLAAPLALGWSAEQELGEWEATMQGSLLLQTLFRLGSPANEVLYESLLALPSLLPLARSQVASHVLVAALATPTATFKQRKDLIASLTLILHQLIDSAPRVAYTVWERSDGFTKERLMFAMQKQERFLQGSTRGRGFVKSVNMQLFRKSVGEWKKWLAIQPKPPALLPRLGQEPTKEAAIPQQELHAAVPPQADDAAEATQVTTEGQEEQPKSKKRPREGKSQREKKKKLCQTDIELAAILADVR